ncbi:MAG: serine/threonine protein kinase [Actinobacteria bacterium]|nr:serine/threonine protein kinase [Actinomycetota bacterium]
MSGTEAPTERVGPAATPARPPGGALVLDRYRLGEQLGVGAFGVVWRARDERLERDVAVKAIAGEQVAAGRATREARAAARLAHPAIVTLYEAGAEDGTTYLVSELVRGGTLAELLREGALSDRDVAEVGIALCAGLAHAHAQGVVHRDVKPSNVLVPDARGAGEPAAKLTDFGVARVVGGGEGTDVLTRTGDVVGTLAYMAPEQAEGREAGAPADLYATALVLYEALSGVNPVRAGSAVATARKLGATLPPLSRQRRDLPPALCAAVDRALLPRPGERGTIAHLSRALRAALRELDDAPGTIAAPALDRAATAVTRVAALRPRRRRSRERELAEVAAELGAGDAWSVEDRRGWGLGPGGAHADRAGGREDARAWVEDPGARTRSGQDPPARAPAPMLSGHVLPGLAAGGLTALALQTLGDGPPPVRPLLAAALVAAVVGLLPRVGWIATAAVLLGWVAGDALTGGGAGLALVLACALAAPPLLLPLRGRAWSVPFAAPLLGVALLAGAYPALAGQARTLWRRAALGALGFWVLALAEPVAHATLYYGRARGTWAGAAWEGSPTDAVAHVLQPLVASGALACAGLWAAAAAVLPWLVRGRSAALDLLAATLWAAALAAGAGMIGHALGPGMVPQPDARGAALGAAAGVLIAVGARATRGAVVGARAGAGLSRASDPRVLP